MQQEQAKEDIRVYIVIKTPLLLDLATIQTVLPLRNMLHLKDLALESWLDD